MAKDRNRDRVTVYGHPMSFSSWVVRMLKLIKLGDMSTAVYRMQKRLIEAGFNVTADGNFGPGTQRAVCDYQERQGLMPDGIVGPATLRVLQLDLTPTALKDTDYVAAAKRLGCDVRMVYAIKRVESAGKGFTADGEPLILFERHYFYRQFLEHLQPGQTLMQRKEQREEIMRSNRDICWPQQLSLKSSAPDVDRYGPSSWQYPRLARARAFSDTAGLESASFGLFQIMGENWSRIGWSSVQAFHRAMQASERDHLDAFVGFCFSKRGLVEAIRDQDFNTVAKLYNGAGAVSVYGPKLRDAFQRA